MKVFLSGGSGFVGREVVRQLLKAEHSVRALLRSPAKDPFDSQVEVVTGDVTAPDSLDGLLAGCDAVINLVGIIREFPGRGITFKRLHSEATGNLVQAAEQQGVPRFLQMSANGARPEAPCNYHKTKWAAEQLVSKSTLDWTIFRPSLIFGPDDQFVNLLAGLIRHLPVIPVMGDGSYRLQPVSVKNVAEGFVRALEAGQTSQKIYHCGGPHSYSYDEILDLIGAALGKKAPVYKLHHPLMLMKPVIALLQSVPQFPMTSEQLHMLLEGNCCDPQDWSTDLNLELIDFPRGIAEYL